MWCRSILVGIVVLTSVFCLAQGQKYTQYQVLKNGPSRSVLQQRRFLGLGKMVLESVVSAISHTHTDMHKFKAKFEGFLQYLERYDSFEDTSKSIEQEFLDMLDDFVPRSILNTVVNFIPSLGDLKAFIISILDMLFPHDQISITMDLNRQFVDRFSKYLPKDICFKIVENAPGLVKKFMVIDFEEWYAISHVTTTEKMKQQFRQRFSLYFSQDLIEMIINRAPQLVPFFLIENPWNWKLQHLITGQKGAILAFFKKFYKKNDLAQVLNLENINLDSFEKEVKQILLMIRGSSKYEKISHYISDLFIKIFMQILPEDHVRVILSKIRNFGDLKLFLEGTLKIIFVDPTQLPTTENTKKGNSNEQFLINFFPFVPQNILVKMTQMAPQLVHFFLSNNIDDWWKINGEKMQNIPVSSDEEQQFINMYWPFFPKSLLVSLVRSSPAVVRFFLTQDPWSWSQKQKKTEFGDNFQEDVEGIISEINLKVTQNLPEHELKKLKITCKQFLDQLDAMDHVTKLPENVITLMMDTFSQVIPQDVLQWIVNYKPDMTTFKYIFQSFFKTLYPSEDDFSPEDTNIKLNIQGLPNLGYQGWISGSSDLNKLPQEWPDQQKPSTELLINWKEAPPYIGNFIIPGNLQRGVQKIFSEFYPKTFDVLIPNNLEELKIRFREFMNLLEDPGFKSKYPDEVSQKLIDLVSNIVPTYVLREAIDSIPDERSLKMVVQKLYNLLYGPSRDIVSDEVYPSGDSNYPGLSKQPNAEFGAEFVDQPTEIPSDITESPMISKQPKTESKKSSIKRKPELKTKEHDSHLNKIAEEAPYEENPNFEPKPDIPIYSINNFPDQNTIDEVTNPPNINYQPSEDNNFGYMDQNSLGGTNYTSPDQYSGVVQSYPQDHIIGDMDIVPNQITFGINPHTSTYSYTKYPNTYQPKVSFHQNPLVVPPSGSYQQTYPFNLQLIPGQPSIILENLLPTLENIFQFYPKAFLLNEITMETLQQFQMEIKVLLEMVRHHFEMIDTLPMNVREEIPAEIKAKFLETLSLIIPEHYCQDLFGYIQNFELLQIIVRQLASIGWNVVEQSIDQPSDTNINSQFVTRFTPYLSKSLLKKISNIAPNLIQFFMNNNLEEWMQTHKSFVKPNKELTKKFIDRFSVYLPKTLLQNLVEEAPFLANFFMMDDLNVWLKSHQYFPSSVQPPNLKEIKSFKTKFASFLPEQLLLQIINTAPGLVQLLLQTGEDEWESIKMNICDTCTAYHKNPSSSRRAMTEDNHSIQEIDIDELVKVSTNRPSSSRRALLISKPSYSGKSSYSFKPMWDSIRSLTKQALQDSQIRNAGRRAMTNKDMNQESKHWKDIPRRSWKSSSAHNDHGSNDILSNVRRMLSSKDETSLRTKTNDLPTSEQWKRVSKNSWTPSNAYNDGKSNKPGSNTRRVLSEGENIDKPGKPFSKEKVKYKSGSGYRKNVPGYSSKISEKPFKFSSRRSYSSSPDYKSYNKGVQKQGTTNKAVFISEYF